MAMELAASSVNVEPLLHDSAAATVMSPLCAPPEPVEMATLALASAVSRVVAWITESSPPAVKPEVSVPSEMVTL